MTTNLYPLKFKPALKDKVWGGHKLEPLVGQPATGRTIGEAWLIWEDLTVDNGPLQGKTIAQLVSEQPAALLGANSAGHTRFPLLIKFLDPQEWLSVQNHPNDEYAQTHEGVPFGKCEVWLVLEATPGTHIIHGLKQTVTVDELKSAMHNGQFRALLDYVEAHPGDIFMNTHGIVHALGPGVMIYELQQSSDITYRLYDWDRKPAPGEPVRELHVDKGAEVADRTPIQQHTIQPVAFNEVWGTRRIFVACQYFAGESLQINRPAAFNTAGRSFHILTNLSGSGMVQAGETTLHLATGESILVPASVGAYHITPQHGAMNIVLAYVPDLQIDLVNPLRQRQISDAAILQLGGDPARSDLRAYLA